MPWVMEMRRGRRPITARLLDGEHLFLPTDDYDAGQRKIGLYSHMRRHGKYLHIAKATRGGVPGLEIWADDDPAALIDREPLPELEAF